MKIKDIIRVFENFAPLPYQENYDNAGLQIGKYNQDVKAAVLCIDITEEVVEEALKLNANLIISHHPLIFTKLHKITDSNYVERTISKAIKSNIAIYTVHTNLDNVSHGVNKIISSKLDLKNEQILSPLKNDLKKLVTFVPVDHIEKVRLAVFNAGAGKIGKYSSCSFNIKGEGTFKAGKSATPFVGKKNQIHFEKEIRFETIYPDYLQNKILDALFSAHPYEEVAYDIYLLGNINPTVGAGMIGKLQHPIDNLDFLKLLSKIFKTTAIRYTNNLSKKQMIKKVALCGGSGSFLIKEAIAQNADVFITGDIKYHQFFEAEDKIIIADIGHYESEQFTTEIFYNVLKEKFPNFAVYFTKVNTNPVKIFTL